VDLHYHVDMSPLRVLLVALATAVLPTLPTQEPAPTFGKVKLDLGGNNWIEYTTKLTVRNTTTMVVTCANACRQRKHLLHAECDTSCDAPCKEIHKYSFEPTMGMRLGGDLKQAQDKFGVKLDADFPNSFGQSDMTWPMARAVADQVTKEFKDKKKTYDLKHWNKTPCSESVRTQTFRIYKVQVDFQYFRNDAGPNDTKILVKGPAGTWDYGTVQVPEGDLSAPVETIKCKCSVVDETKKDGAGLWIQEKDKTYFASSKVIEEKGITVECGSMNACTLSCTNPTSAPFDVFVAPGTIFECADDSFQDEVCCESVRLHCAPMSTGRATMHVMGWDGIASAEGAAACINMHRKEPRAGLKYRFMMPTQGSLARLAEKVDGEMIRGPKDQIRIWIITDHATRDEMAKILLPRPTRGAYLDSLYEVNLLTGTDLRSPEFASCLEPGLAIGGSASQPATQWYVNLWASKDPAALAKWLRSNTSSLTEECFGPNTRETQATHAADLFNALCATRHPALIDAGMTCLEKAVPADKRALVVKAHGLDGVFAQLMASDSAAASRALDLAELYRDPSVMVPLLNLNPALSDAVKQRAGKLFHRVAAREHN
jgi:hypothetical protein